MANSSDFFQKVGDPGSATTLSAPGYTIGDTSINVGSTANWPSDTGITIAIDEAEVVDGVEVRVDGTYNEYRCVVATGTSANQLVWARGDGNRNYAAGALTRVYIPISAERENRLVEGILEHANQDGTLIGQAVRDALSIGDNSNAGWDINTTSTITNVTNNGNRSYTLTHSASVANVISEGMRRRFTRTVATGTQSFSLDGTNDYYNKTSPAGMTFTDDFSVSAWVYLTAYQQCAVVSRYNGTSGWVFRVESDGTMTILGYNAAAANFSRVQSYQSLPLNKWVHIAGQLDMSTFTATTTTSYFMIDGVNVPAFVNRGGTNPTTLVQAGNLEIGSTNGGTLPFPGYIDQVAIYSAKVPQADHVARMSQPLLGTESNLISAYTNGSTTDLNITNANNLTAQNGATTATVTPFGNNGKSTTLEYGLTMSVSSDGLTEVVQVPEGCALPTTGGITSQDYSTQGNPFGWVSDKGRWEVSSVYRSDRTTTAAAETWKTVETKLVMPLGSWEVDGAAQLYQSNSSVGGAYLRFGISNAENAEPLPYNCNFAIHNNNVPTAGAVIVPATVGFFSTISSSTSYYLSVKAVAISGTCTIGFYSNSQITALPQGL